MHTITYGSSLNYLGLDENDPNNSFIGVYTNTQVNMTIAFSKVIGQQTVYPSNINASCTCDTINLSTGSSSVNITGTATGDFNESHFFLFPDNSVRLLPINNTENWDNIVKWQPPANTVDTITYTFNVTYSYNDESGSTETTDTVIITQSVFWNYVSAMIGFRRLLERNKF